MKLEVEQLCKSFGAKQVLHDVSFCAESGRAFGLLGRNGAGKTTSIRIIMDVLPADSGRILVEGKPIDYTTCALGYLPEERGLYARKKIIDQLVYFARLKGLSKYDAVKACDAWLSRLGMSEYRDKRLDTLSKGNQQKIQLITALAHNPAVIILDEPFSGLDPVNAGLLRDVVNEELERGKVVIFSSHQMSYVEEFCRHIALIDKGRVVLGGDLAEIKRTYPRNMIKLCSPKSYEVAAFLRELGGIVDNVEVSEGGLFVTLTSPEEKMALVREVTSRFEIDEIRVIEPTLNDIFVETVTEESADTKAEEE